MKRIFLLVVPALALFTVATGQMKVNQTKQAGDSEQDLMRVEREWVDAYVRGDASALKQYLAGDFRLTTGDGVSDRAHLIEAARNNAAGFASVELSARRVSIYGDTAVSTGLATLRKPRDSGDAPPTEIRGEAATATVTAEVNVAELARREAENPPAQRQRAIHPPMSAPDDDLPPRDESLAPAATTGGGEYRYTAVYVRRGRRWQAVALQLTRVAQP